MGHVIPLADGIGPPGLDQAGWVESGILALHNNNAQSLNIGALLGKLQSGDTILIDGQPFVVAMAHTVTNDLAGWTKIRTASKNNVVLVTCWGIYGAFDQ